MCYSIRLCNFTSYSSHSANNWNPESWWSSRVLFAWPRHPVTQPRSIDQLIMWEMLGLVSTFCCCIFLREYTNSGTSGCPKSFGYDHDHISATASFRSSHRCKYHLYFSLLHILSMVHWCTGASDNTESSHRARSCLLQGVLEDELLSAFFFTATSILW